MVILFDQHNLPTDIYEIVFATTQQKIVGRVLIDYLKQNGVIVIVDNIIQREGYGFARNHLREMAKKHSPHAHWCAYFDADETISEKEFHRLRFIKDYLINNFDVVAFPRIDWHDNEMTKAENEWRTAPDWQARMSRPYTRQYSGAKTAVGYMLN